MQPELQLEISPIQKIEHAISFLASYHHEEWQHLNSHDYSIQDRINEYHNSNVDGQLPVMLVAHEGRDCFGSVRLIKQDMDNHPELVPWLASLYVLDEYRFQGIAGRLIEASLTKAQHMNFNTVYLYTEHQASYYQKRNWKVLTRETYHDSTVTIMYYKLN